MAVQFQYRRPKIDARIPVNAAAAAGANAGAKIVLKASQPKVPVDSRRLKKSGRVVREGTHAYVTYGRDDDGVSELTGFESDGAATGRESGAPTNQYVVVQHEDYELNHPNGGEAGFLLKPFRSESKRIVEAMAVLMRKVFK